MFTYTLKTTKDAAELVGKVKGSQPVEVLKVLQHAKGPVTTGEVAKAIEKKIETVQTPERVAGWYLKMFLARGLVTRAEVAKAKVAEAKTKVKAAVKASKAKKTVTPEPESKAA